MTAITARDGLVIRISGSDRDAGSRETTPETGSTVVEVGPTGVPDVETLVTATRDGRTAFYLRCSSRRVEEVVAEVAETGDVASADPDAVTDHDPGRTRVPNVEVSGLGGRDVLGACGWRRPTNRTDHEAAGGFGEPDTKAVLAVGESLRGRGWGDLRHDEPTSETWNAVRRADGEKAVVVNGHGNAADALLLASAPFEVLDGAVAVARTVGADRVLVYASAGDRRAVETAREAVENYPGRSVEIEVVTGPTEYRAAEPTMAVEALEGNHRLEARIRPPDLDEVGLHGDPTAVHTSRTLAHLSVALREGRTPETRVLTVTGDVESPVTVEVPADETLETAVDAADVAGEFKAASVGGRFGGLTRTLDVGVDPDALTAADLGTEGVVHVLTTDRCVVEFVGRRTRYAAEENCGRCVPCREGTTQLVELLRDVYDGGYRPDDIEELVDVMSTSSLCAFGVQAGRPSRTALAEFESEFEAHADGRCPAGSCLEALEAH